MYLNFIIVCDLILSEREKKTKTADSEGHS